MVWRRFSFDLMDDEGGSLLYGCDSKEQQNSFDSTCRMLHRFLSESASSQLSDLQSVRVFWPLSMPSGINPLWLLIELYYAGVDNCGLTASAKIYVLPRCSARLAVALVQRSKASRYRFLDFHRFLPTDTLRASKSCWMARASALQECICTNRDSQNLQRGIMNALLSVTRPSLLAHRRAYTD